MYRMNMMMRLCLVCVTIVFFGAECEQERLDKLDNGRMTLEDGTELRPMVLPWEVIVSDEVEHIEVVLEAFEDVNVAVLPVVAFQVRVDQDAFEEVWLLAPEQRMGIVLVTEGFGGTPGGMDDSGVSFEDPGGYADLVWNNIGEIIAADIVISSDIAYDRQTVRDVTSHEAGHTLGLEHDDSSLDLRSCMASPPEYDCQWTAQDVALIQDD